MAINFVHLTDLHISAPEPKDTSLLSDTTATLETIITLIQAIEPRPAFVVVSGDLTNRGDVASYRLLKQMMAAIDVPVVYALGNHDIRPSFYEGMLGRSEDPEAPYCHDRLIAGVHVVVLDSSVRGRIGGALSPDQFTFLEGALERHGEAPKIVVVHHAPALEEGNWETLTTADTERLADTLRGRNVAGMLTGHIHHDRVSHWYGIPVIVGTGQHNAIDPLFSKGLRLIAGTGFAYCSLRPSGLSVSFIALPSDRRELGIITPEILKTFV